MAGLKEFQSNKTCDCWALAECYYQKRTSFSEVASYILKLYMIYNDYINMFKLDLVIGEQSAEIYYTGLTCRFVRVIERSKLFFKLEGLSYIET